eukprot:9101467-Pyramimonas_sp.AAC.1
MEAQLVTVRDTGAAAVRALRDDLSTVLQTPPMEVEQHAATMHSNHTTLTSELDGKLPGAEMALTRRLEAFEGRAQTLENRVPQ